MLAFFRKYQRYVYTVITVIIVISFSFFGTYGAITDDGYQDTAAFTAVDGSTVTRSELERMALLIGTDVNDLPLVRGAFNDGVIEKDILNTGIGAILAAHSAEELKEDLGSRQAREKRFTPYRHPYNPAISAEEMWARYNPQMVEAFTRLRQSSDPLSSEAFQARVNLYLAERAFTGQDLQLAIRYVEQMNAQYMQPDGNLPYSDLSLFGYHTAEDWFGPKFIRLVSQFVINSSKIAESKGYTVPKEEVLADLARNAERSFSQAKQYGQVYAANSAQYFEEQLRRMHMDQTQAIKTWRQVMLFRRMFQDVGNAVVTDSLVQEAFYAFAKDTVTGQNWALPPEARLGSFRDMQLFETYIKAVAPKRENLLDLPVSYLPQDKIPQQLLQRSYRIEFGEVDNNQLQTLVGIRDMWNWQATEEGLAKLSKEFPELTSKAALEQLDDATRSRVDSFSRQQIVASNPEWVTEALQKSPKQQKNLMVRQKGGSDPLKGVGDRVAFMKFLDAEGGEQPRMYTPDNKNYFLITVIEKSPETQIMTFAEAKKEGALAEMLDEQLQAYYERIRDASPKEFQMPDGTWKELAYVKDQVAERYFAKLLEAIKAKTPDAAAAVRFLPYMQAARSSLMKSQPETVESNALTDQWKLVETSFTSDRADGQLPIAGSWTEVEEFPNGALSFRHILGRESQPEQKLVVGSVEKMHRALSNAAQQAFAVKVLEM